jgi:hypothetical protein
MPENEPLLTLGRALILEQEGRYAACDRAGDRTRCQIDDPKPIGDGDVRSTAQHIGDPRV